MPFQWDSLYTYISYIDRITQNIIDFTREKIIIAEYF